MSDLIDTTEMYLRTLYELEEEGVPPLRARIAERIGHSGPTVSQTVARMERDGLLTVEEDRRIVLSQAGRQRAVRVMRKHRLAERLLTDVIGLDLAEVHEEACRWEHVISEAVELRLVEVLGHPTFSPYGNRIPALSELGVPDASEDRLPPLSSLLGTRPVDVRVGMLDEFAQGDNELLALLTEEGVLPHAALHAQLDGHRLHLTVPDVGACTVEPHVAEHIFVDPTP